MQYFINPENVGFYLSFIHSDIPDTAVEITAETYQWLREGQSTGKQIAFGSDGQPKLVDTAQEPENLAATIAGRRYQAEVAGITVNGMAVATDRDSQGLVNSAALSAFMDDTYSCNLKAGDGYVEFNAKAILIIAKLVRAHVQACIDREAALLSEVKTGTYTAAMLEEGWPA